MPAIGPEYLLIILCSLVILSYGFSVVSRYIKVPSVLLLLFAGIGFKAIANANALSFDLPATLIEGLGTVGLIMIVLEAGLDLRLEKSKLTLIRNSFSAAVFTLIFSAVIITAILHYWLLAPITNCIVYALPLSIMSSSIVLPSIHHLTEQKKEFLVYEASFSDILGIMFFNHFTAKEILTAKSFGLFGLNLVVAVILSLLFSGLLFLLLIKTKLNIKFFLVFSLLVLIYAGGKLLHLPSLLIILVFGMMMNNWEKVPFPSRLKLFRPEQLEGIRQSLHFITAETSFIIRTFFFILFGYSIDLAFVSNAEVILVGSMIVVSLFVVRYVYLRFAFKTRVFPEVFFIPRGLITIVLFYKIPPALALSNFQEGILFFIVLSTGIILSLGMIFYHKKSSEVVEEPQFAERKEVL